MEIRQTKILRKKNRKILHYSFLLFRNKNSGNSFSVKSCFLLKEIWNRDNSHQSDLKSPLKHTLIWRENQYIIPAIHNLCLGEPVQITSGCLWYRKLFLSFLICNLLSFLRKTYARNPMSVGGATVYHLTTTR